MASQFKDIRKDLEQDELVASMMAGLRGTNMNNSNFADEGESSFSCLSCIHPLGVTMRLVEVNLSDDPNDRLPLVYDPEKINTFWAKRPVAVTTRMLQLFGKYNILFVSKL